MKLVGSALGGGVDDAAARAAVFRRVGIGLDRELLHGFRREADHRARHAHARVVHAVRHHHGAAGAAAVNVQVEPGHGAAGAQARVLGAHIAADVGNQNRQVEHAAIDRGALSI